MEKPTTINNSGDNNNYFQSPDPIRATSVWVKVVCSGCNLLRDEIARNSGEILSSFITNYYCCESLKFHHFHETYLCLNCVQPSDEFKNKCCVKKDMFFPLSQLLPEDIVLIIIKYI